MIRTIALSLLVIKALAAGTYLLPRILCRNRVEVRNSTPHQLSDIRLEMDDLEGRRFLDRELPRMAPGESVVFRHRECDWQGEVRFLLGGEEQRHVQERVDLWAGEGWVFEVLPDGTVRTGYDHPGFLERNR